MNTKIWMRSSGDSRSSGFVAQLAIGIVSSIALFCTPSAADPSLGPKPAGAAPATSGGEEIYSGGLRSGWQDWGWGAHDLSGASASINFSNFGGWILHHDSRTARYGAVSFSMLAPRSFGSFLELRLANGNSDNSFPAVAVGPERSTPSAGGWVEVRVPWQLLNPSGSAFDRITLRAATPVGADWVRFDHLLLTRFDPAQVPASAVAASSNAASREARAAVECRAKARPISPYIYGIVSDEWDLGAASRRWGGNPTSRYNWQLGNAYNSGKDWYFENVKSADYRQFLADDLARHVTSALTVPIIGWVAKDMSSSGFPRSLFGPQAAEDQGRHAGNGVRPDGTLIRPGPATQTSVEASPAMIKRWVEAIRRQDQKDGARSVDLYFLDNEPNLWNSTHRDVHPDPLTYDELLDRTLRYGTAIREADPQAVIAGPAEWGWTGYFYSATDALNGVGKRPDRRAHGDVPLIPWYLKKLREHQQRTGTKILDVLDVHYYPQADGVYGVAVDDKTAALRLRSTRSLWDPTYKDESWINDTVRLIPRLKGWIADNYPGLKLSIGEYNFGGEQHMSGALAEAEALGRFGQQGVDYAYYWTAPPKGSPAYWAFRAYRNFDGNNGRFQDYSLETKADASVSLFASRDESGKHLVLIALNLDPQSSARTAIALNGCGEVASRRKFSYEAGNSAIVAGTSGAAAGFDETLAPYSINVFDIVLK